MPADSSDSQETLSSGLYIVVRENVLDLADEHHFVIYWPIDTTRSDSVISSVRHNRVTFRR